MSALNLDALMAKAQGRPFPSATTSGISTQHMGATAQGGETFRFLRMILPSSGHYISAEIGDSATRQFQHPSIEAIASSILEKSATGSNVYFAVASYQAGAGKVSRKAECVSRIRSFFLDIDCAKGPNTYPTEQALDAALAEFIQSFGIAPTAIVNSGAGRHVYWTLESDLERDEWYPLANALKSYSARWGLLADHAVTADAARILRAPGTLTKHGNIAALTHMGSATSVSEIRAGLERIRLSASPRDRKEGSAIPYGLVGPMPSVFHGTSDNALSENISTRSDWLKALPPERQLQLLDEMMTACPETFWSHEPSWAQVTHAIAALIHLPQESRLDLLERHSARSPKWAVGGWSRERLLREKWQNADGTASLLPLIQTAESNGWQRPLEVAMPIRFTDRESLISYLATQYAYVAEQGAYLNRRTRTLIHREALVESESWRVPADSEKPINLAAVLRTDRRIERVDAIGYAPGEGSIYIRDERRIANIYQAWEPVPLTPLSTEIQLLQDFLTHVTPDDEGREFRRWAWQGLAWLVQRPSARLPVATLLAGAQGCGKSTLLETIPRLLFGARNVASVTAGELDSQFSDWLGNARILTMPELRMVSARDARRVADSLKPIITSPTVRVHPKGAKGFEQDNVLSIFATSNHGDAVHLEDDDRRWVVYESPAGRMPDDLAGRLYAFLNGPRGAGVLRNIFHAMNVSNFNPHALPLLSNAKRRMIEASRSPIEDSLVARYERGEFPFDLPLITIDDCRTALAMDRVDYRGNAPQAIVRALQARPIGAEAIGRFRIGTQGSQWTGTIQSLPRCRVYVTRSNSPEKWKTASEEYVRSVLRSRQSNSQGTQGGPTDVRQPAHVNTQ